MPLSDKDKIRIEREEYRKFIAEKLRRDQEPEATNELGDDIGGSKDVPTVADLLVKETEIEIDNTEEEKQVEVPPNPFSLATAKAPARTQKKPTSDTPKSQRDKMGCLGGIVTFIVLLAIVLIFIQLSNPGYISGAWRFWVADSWIGDSFNSALAWFWQTAFWSWVKTNSGWIILGAVVIGFLALISSASSDVAGSDDKGCLLLILCLLFPPLIIIVLILWAIMPSKDNED